MQQGIQTEMNRKKNITIYEDKEGELPKAIIIWKSDAQVLNRTCPE